MKAQALTIFIVVSVYWLAFAPQLHPPSPTPRVHGQDNKSKADGKNAIASDDQSDPSAVPSAINKLTSEIASWEKQESSRHHEPPPPVEGWQKASIIISVAATVAIAVLGFMQWLAMDKQRQAMEQQAKHMEMLERAEVSVQEISLSGSQVIEPETELIILLNNLGRTRANHVKVSITISIDGQIRNPNPSGLRDMPLVILPGSPQHIHLGKADLWLAESDFSRIREYDTAPYVKIEIGYRDVFTNERQTTIGGILDPQYGIRVREYESW